MFRPNGSQTSRGTKYKAVFLILIILGSLRVEAHRHPGSIKGLLFIPIPYLFIHSHGQIYTLT